MPQSSSLPSFSPDVGRQDITAEAIHGRNTRVFGRRESSKENAQYKPSLCGLRVVEREAAQIHGKRYVRLLSRMAV